MGHIVRLCLKKIKRKKKGKMLDTVFGHAQNKEERLEWQEHLEPAVFSKKKRKSTESKEHTEDRCNMLTLKVNTSLSRYPTES